MDLSVELDDLSEEEELEAGVDAAAHEEVLLAENQLHGDDQVQLLQFVQQEVRVGQQGLQHLGDAFVRIFRLGHIELHENRVGLPLVDLLVQITGELLKQLIVLDLNFFRVIQQIELKDELQDFLCLLVINFSFVDDLQAVFQGRVCHALDLLHLLIDAHLRVILQGLEEIRIRKGLDQVVPLIIEVRRDVERIAESTVKVA